MEAVEAGLSTALVPMLVLPCLDELPEHGAELRVERLDQEHNIEVLGRTESETRPVHQHVDRSSADKNKAIGVVGEVLSEPDDPPYHGSLSIIRVSAACTRSSGSSRSDR